MRMAEVGRGGAELLLTLLALAWLVWLGRGLGGAEWQARADGRFKRDGELRVEAPAQAPGWLARFCGELAANLPDRRPCAEFQKPDPRARLLARLGHAPPAPGFQPLDAGSTAKLAAFAAAAQAAREDWMAGFYRPFAEAEDIRRRAQAGAQEGFDAEEADALSAQQEERLKAYREAYRLNPRHGQRKAYSRPVQCAFAYLARRAFRPEAALALAAVLDGRRDKLLAAAVAPVPGDGPEGWSREETADGCADAVYPAGQTTPLQAARKAAAVLQTARASAANARKAEATLDMLPRLVFRLAVWGLAGWLALAAGRRPGRGLALGLGIWAGACAATRPALEWPGLGALPGGWLALGLAGLAVLAWPLRGPARPAAAPASRLAYPGLVLFTGLGWLLLADVSTYADPDNRFSATYQQASVLAAFMLASLTPAMSLPLARLGLRAWTWLPLLAAGRPLRGLLVWLLGLGLAAGGLGLIGLLLRGHRQQTSELFRFVLLSGLAWFLLARVEALGSPWLAFAQNRPWWRHRPVSLPPALLVLRLKFALPLLALLGFVGGGFFVTEDKGPLLVALYAGAVFFGMGVARLAAARLGQGMGLPLGMLSVPLYVFALSWALFRFGGLFGDYIALRLESADTPFAASNDQIAQILWFQQAALENGGFGLGLSPWCGDLAGACRGVPAQIQSDYVFTALVGVFGPGAWALALLFVLWLWRLARAQAAATSGRLAGEGLAQAWLGWLCLCWAGLNLAQMAVTVAGNLSWLPLTGITFPFLSFGAWSLLANALFLGLALNVARRD